MKLSEKIINTILLGILSLTIHVSFAYSAEITLDLSYYNYEEPNFMSDTSDPAFISLGVKNWDLPKNSDSVWNFLYTTELSKGWVSYSGSGTLDKDYYKLRGEAYLGYKIDDFISIIGMGYRWLYDDSGGSVSSNGALGYDRENHLFYVPVGGILDLSDKLRIKAQYNYLILGTQTSYLSDVAGFTDVTNEQRFGWGTDFTLDYKIDNKTSVYSFARYWDIANSDTATGTFAGVLLFQAFEPANTTAEVGIGISYNF